jgi:hypothetical protein
MESGCSSIKLRYMHLLLREFNEVLQMLLENTGENTLIRQCQITVLSFLLTVNSETQEYFKECDGMFTVHILYIM